MCSYLFRTNICTYNIWICQKSKDVFFSEKYTNMQCIASNNARELPLFRWRESAKAFWYYNFNMVTNKNLLMNLYLSMLCMERGAECWSKKRRTMSRWSRSEGASRRLGVHTQSRPRWCSTRAWPNIIWPDLIKKKVPGFNKIYIKHLAVVP